MTTSSTPNGPVRLVDLFEGRPQLIVYHFMFHPDWDDGCPSWEAALVLESTGGSYYFLDLTALGRQEDWEQPEGRSDAVRGSAPDFATT